MRLSKLGLTPKTRNEIEKSVGGGVLTEILAGGCNQGAKCVVFWGDL